MSAPLHYYNEIDPYCAAWLQNLMDAGEIPRGVIDTRSIEDVTPADLAGFTQCHFFAGLGGWPLALRLAGWPESRRAWTGSCPCQPFSAAGKGAGFADERHLWPAWQHLIAQCRPAVIFGEQVASKAVDPWIDLVHADLEGMGYAFGCVPFPSAGVGAPHIRDRTYWVADAEQYGSGRQATPTDHQWTQANRPADRSGGCGSAFVRLADATQRGWREERADGGRIGARDSAQGLAAGLVHGRMRGGLADAKQHDRGRQAASADHVASESDRPADRTGGRSCTSVQRPGPTNGQWRAADWLGCTDGKWRPVIATHVALVDGLSGTMGSLRPERKTQEELVNHAASSHSNADQLLPSMWGSTATENDQRETGGSRGFHAPDLLQPAVHGEWHGQGGMHKPESHSDESTPASDASLPKMRKDGQAACPSSGREPFQQFAVELDDIVSLLSPSIALAANDGRWRDLEALRSLCKAICEAGFVQYAPEQAQALWASLGEEAKDRIRLGFDVRAWRKLVFSPLSVGEPGRVGRLRAYGNAINPHQAAEFVSAFVQSEIFL